MIKKIGQHTVIYGIGTLASKSVAFWLLPLYTSYLKPADFGVLGLISITTDIAGTILGGGLAGAMLRFWNKGDDPEERRTCVATALTATLIFGIVGIGLAVLLSPLLAQIIITDPRYVLALSLGFIGTMFELSLAIPMDFLRARERSTNYVLISFIRGSANMGLTIYLVVGQKMGVEGAIWPNVIIGGLVAPVLIIHTLRLVGGFKLSGPLLRAMLAYGLPLVPTVLSLTALTSANRYFLKHYENLTAVGLFSLAATIAAIPQGLVTASFNQVWTFMMFDAVKRKNAAEIIARVLTYYLLVLVYVSLIICALAGDLLRVMAQPAYWSAYTVIPTILLGVIAYGAASVTSTGFYVHDRTLWRTYLVFGAAGLSLLLNIILIPRLHLQGAALATSLAFLALFFATAWLAQKLLPVAWEVRRCVQLVVIATGLGAAALATIGPFSGLWPGACLRALIAFSLPLWLLLTGFFSAEEIRAVRCRFHEEESTSVPS
jgi:O-antigen/teichoic acid export membrane protein